jgi:hypothetical protein
LQKQTSRNSYSKCYKNTCLFIYAPHKKYLASSYWLNKKENKLKDKMLQQRFELATPQQPEGDETKQLVGSN